MKYLLGEKIHFDGKIVFITITSTLLLIVDHYHTLTGFKHLDRVILYFVIPLAFTVILFREHPKKYGFGFGNWKLGISYTVIGITVITPIIYLLARGDLESQSYYNRTVIGLPWTTFLDLIGWEFFFRGWILFGYARKFEGDALWLQAVPFALAHIGKPEVETVSTIFGGFLFGWMAWQTKSFVYPFLVHWYISTLVILFSSGVL